MCNKLENCLCVQETGPPWYNKKCVHEVHTGDRLTKINKVLQIPKRHHAWHAFELN